jgi:serine/threonine-protein kinase
VALKFIHSSRLRQTQAKDRLFREARAAASIDHPNVGAIYEISEVEHQPFIAMAYVKGQELEERVAEGPLEIAESLDIAAQLAAGLAAAHGQGVIHCDLSPTNIILGTDGRVRVVDFGVAKLSSATRLSEPNLMGTANYVSPEQMKGEPVDLRTDIWSLGVILYEMLTGKRPFEADHREAVYYAIAHKTPEPMSRWRPGIPAALESIVFKCLEKDPARRYQDADTVKADLSALHQADPATGDNLPKPPVFLGEAPTHAEPQSESASGPRPPVARPGTRGRSAGWAVAAILATLLIWIGSDRWIRSYQPGKASTTALIANPRLVVLPFESRTPGEENQALSYAISDSVITNLAKVRGLQVTSWTTVMRLSERKATLPEIAKILNVQYALEGSLLKSGQQGHVTVQLIRVSDDSHIWAEEFDFPWKNLVTVRERVSESVARQMKAELRPEERRILARNSTESMGAYQARARGRYGLVRYSYHRDPAYLIEAEKHFKRALEEDPKYADVLADLAYTNYLRFYPPQGDRKELVGQGIAYAERALALDPNNVVALYVLGSLYDHVGKPEKGLELCQKAVELAPDDPEPHHHLAWRYLERGFYESGIRENGIAIEKDSLFLDPYFFQTLFLTRLGRYKEALKTVRQLEEVEPTNTYAAILRANIAFAQGDLVQAEAGWRKVLETSPQAPERSNITRVLLGLMSARKGRIDEARQILESFETRPSRANDYPIRLAAMVGKKELALDLIRENQLFRNYRWLVSEPDIAPLHTEPRYRALLVDLYQKWQRDLSTLGPSLPVLPPDLPTPEDFLKDKDPEN